ncbi:uncharacterized protein MELLADRAFT_85564 [Melampsora larici-populina 98AG31]|uniref:DNL-type domain-containing protein n=1 Tax=Melampsora larici-populina (strain 98AG31 / pathotype 3-4-7) TaxID=747676 RepID=F4RJ72_MELLP|nr:uncharacterized protein MELLADRAFT_85564 [Melampsora larici-populina 98AG31]EGG07681.1 hypothetical protein MELLADRAFT_85564 [Melampsora larici-populina 98AG31]
MKIQFTCKAKDAKTSKTCDTTNNHEFSKLAYEKGIVLVECPACQNRHLIADHLSWFTNNSTSDDPNFKNDYRNIVDLMKSKGEKVKRGKISDQNGEVLEYYDD